MSSVVLILEDDPGDAFLVEHRLNDIAKPEVVTTAVDALARLSQEPAPDVVILDYNVPGDLSVSVVIDFIDGHDWPNGERPLVLIMSGAAEAVPESLRLRADVVSPKNGVEYQSVRDLVEHLRQTLPTPTQQEPTKASVPWGPIIGVIGLALFIPMMVLTIFIIRELGAASGGRTQIDLPGDAGIDVEVYSDEGDRRGEPDASLNDVINADPPHDDR